MISLVMKILSHRFTEIIMIIQEDLKVSNVQKILYSSYVVVCPM